MAKSIKKALGGARKAFGHLPGGAALDRFAGRNQVGLGLAMGPGGEALTIAGLTRKGTSAAAISKVFQEDYGDTGRMLGGKKGENIGVDFAKFNTLLPGTDQYKDYKAGGKAMFQKPEVEEPEPDPAIAKAQAEEEARRRARRVGRALLLTSRGAGGANLGV